MPRHPRLVRPLALGLTALSLTLSLPAADVLAYQPRVAPVIKPRAAFFSPAEVRLLDGPLATSRDAAARNILKLDIDRLLAPFVLTSGGEPKHSPYLGWETAYLPGVGLSFYLSGISRMYAATGDKAYGDRIDAILDQLAVCQTRTDGYLLGTSGGLNIFRRLEQEGFYPGFRFWGKGEATPYYAMEKLMSGLRDVYRITGKTKALEIETALGNWVARHMAFLSDDELQKIMTVEWGGMNWVLADLYADTGDRRFLLLSRRWQDNITMQPSIRGEAVLEGKHANTQFPKFSGLAARYPFSGDKDDLTGARFFWDSVVHHHSYATGGNSENEHFWKRDTVANRLSPYTEENCNMYNMLRMTRLLAEIEPRAEYADYLERALFNHILAAQNTASGEVCYFLPLMPGAERVYQPLEYFSCCTASALDSYTRHAEYLYARTAEALYVNLFAASEVNWAEKGVRLRQETRFPDVPATKLIVDCPQPTAFELRLRDPYWAQGGVRLELNGQVLAATPTDGYFRLRRTWAKGDTLDVTFPMPLRLERAPDDENLVALFRGPIILAGEFTREQGDRLTAHRDVPGLVTAGRAIDTWLKPVDGESLVFTTNATRPEPVRLSPLFRRVTGNFGVYWRLTTDEALHAQAKSRQDAAAALERATVDRVVVGDVASERSHGLFGESQLGEGNKGILMTTKWRDTRTAFGYTLAVDGAAPMALHVTFMGRAAWEFWNCHIMVDDVPVETLRRGWDATYPAHPWTAAYPIPADVTAGKQSVKVTFVSKREMIRSERSPDVPRLMEVRTLRAADAAR